MNSHVDAADGELLNFSLFPMWKILSPQWQCYYEYVKEMYLSRVATRSDGVEFRLFRFVNFLLGYGYYYGVAMVLTKSVICEIWFRRKFGEFSIHYSGFSAVWHSRTSYLQPAFMQTQLSTSRKTRLWDGESWYAKESLIQMPVKRRRLVIIMYQVLIGSFIIKATPTMGVWRWSPSPSWSCSNHLVLEEFLMTLTDMNHMILPQLGSVCLRLGSGAVMVTS